MDFIVKHWRLLTKWLVKVLKKWVWALGFIPQLLDFLATYVPREQLPLPIKTLLESGVSWSWTVALFAMGFLISSYLVYRETQQELEDARMQILTESDRKPDLVLSLRNRKVIDLELLHFDYDSPPLPPDFHEQINQRRAELLAAEKEMGSSIYRLRFVDSDGNEMRNTNYEEDVQRYLKDYEVCLICRHERSLNLGRAIFPILANKGKSPANDITVELSVQPDYVLPDEHQRFDRDLIFAENEQIKDYLFGDNPDKWISHDVLAACPKPKKPSRYIRFDSLSDGLMLAGLNDPCPPIASEPPNTSGPDFVNEGGRTIIRYSISRLIQHQHEEDFEPFYIWLGDIRETIEWNIEITIVCAELGEPLFQDFRFVLSPQGTIEANDTRKLRDQ